MFGKGWWKAEVSVSRMIAWPSVITAVQTAPRALRLLRLRHYTIGNGRKGRFDDASSHVRRGSSRMHCRLGRASARHKRAFCSRGTRR